MGRTEQIGAVIEELARKVQRGDGRYCPAAYWTYTRDGPLDTDMAHFQLAGYMSDEGHPSTAMKSLVGTGSLDVVSEVNLVEYPQNLSNKQSRAEHYFD